MTPGQLNACGVASTQARIFADPLSVVLARFDITTPARQAAFIGQCMVESACFMRTEENLFYTHPEHIVEVWPSLFRTAADAAPYARNPAKLAAHVYAGRNGNGNEASGDGWRYRGRGLLQITGRDAYVDSSNGLAHDYVGQPDLVALPPDACLTAAWYWHVHKLNVLADAGAIDEITRAINGAAMRDRALRRQYTEQALSALEAAS